MMGPSQERSRVRDERISVSKGVVCPVEFLVRVQIDWPSGGDEGKRRRLIAQEAARAAELASAGHLLRLWRTGAGWGNTGLWSAEDATELHGLIRSLPLFPWMKADVEPLARHPSDPGGTELQPVQRCDMEGRKP